jgi:hypothetical protein
VAPTWVIIAYELINMPSYPTVQAAVSDRTKRLLDILAALNGKTTSSFLASNVEDYISQNLSPEEQETYLNKAQVGQKPKATSRPFRASKQ